MRRATLLSILIVVATSLPLSAQDVIMGGVASPRIFLASQQSDQATFVYLAPPANAAGSLPHAVVRIFGPCTPTFRLSFTRPSRANLNVFAERGPFAAVSV